MLFPNIEDFAIAAVVTVNATDTVRCAIGSMSAHNLRDVVVVGSEAGRFGIFTAADLIRQHIKNADLDRSLGEAGYRDLPVAAAGTNILEAMRHFGRDDEYICVVDAQGSLHGIVSYTDVAAGIDPKVLIERQRIGDLIGRHGIKTIGAGARLDDALSLLEMPSDAVVVMRENRPVGILTTKDAVRLIGAAVSFAEPVERFMSTPLETVGQTLNIREALDYLQERHFKRLVVHTERGGLLGVVTQRELVAIAYSRWTDLMHNHALELREVVALLERKAAKLELIAATDTLTGIPNRSRFEERLEREIERESRYGDGGFALLFADIDHFKSINDSRGHMHGDEALKEVARLLAGQMRGIDTVARWGGEEFAALLPHTGPEEAQRVAERLRLTVEGAAIGAHHAVTISIGVTTFQPGETAHTLFERADRALYQAKNNGRNRVEMILSDVH